MAWGNSPIEILASNAMVNGLIFCSNFTYSATWLTGTGTALGANGTVESDIQINADADFVVQEMNLTSWSAAGTPITSPDYTITIVMSGSGRQIMNQAQSVSLYTGAYVTANGVQQPLQLAMPLLITANSTLANTLINRTGTAANRVDLMMRGFKVYYTGGNRQSIFHVL
jgi:hypothetical protein